MAPVVRANDNVVYHSRSHVVARSHCDLIVLFCGDSAWRHDLTRPTHSTSTPCQGCRDMQARHKAGELIPVFDYEDKEDPDASS